MHHYTHLTMSERRRLCILRDMGLPITEIACRLNRHRSTLYRELQRNNHQTHYLPGLAQQKAITRQQQQRPCKIQHSWALYDYIRFHLKQGWSPEQIAGRLKCRGKATVCHETIYRFIYRRRRKSLYHCLPYKRPSRRKHFARKQRQCRYSERRLITQRPIDINSRQQLGHWEGDSIEFSSSKAQRVTTLLERQSRIVILIKSESRQSSQTMAGILAQLQPFATKARQTITFDQGSEFAYFNLLERRLACRVYYCHTRSPWEKGSNENMNGRLQRYLPRSVDPAHITQTQLDVLAKKMNNTPRKCLGFRTPKEAFLLHCKTYWRASM